MKEKIISVLKEITDPEIDISIWDLGLIYGVDFKEGEVVIRMTLTAPGCPFMSQLTDQVEKKVAQLEGVKKVRVDLVFDPPWSLEKMSKEGKRKLGI